ncbi:recombinase family protein [Kordiimonas sp.]|uniref:recombinase family protein n=1 Tax=Kordiimonas sp. TaxID=1970157 RepID=UPI003A8F760E
MTNRAALYLRVSTDKQTTENQRQDLLKLCEYRGWTIVGEYSDEGISGTSGREKRPGLNALLKDATRRRFDVAVFWSVDRLGRSTAKVATAMEELDALGVSQFYHKEAIDSATPHGRAMLQMAAVFATLERDMIAERVKAGLERAKAQGKRLGRAPVSAIKRREITEKRAEGLSYRATAEACGVALSTVYKVLKEAAQQRTAGPPGRRSA